MDADDPQGAVRVPANPLDGAIEFLERFGFRLEEIAPADDPSEALMTGHGLRLRLDRSHHGAIELVVPAGGALLPGRHLSPGGLAVEVSAPNLAEVPPPAPAFVQRASPRHRSTRVAPACSTGTCFRHGSVAGGSPAISAPPPADRSRTVCTTTGSGSS
ncbi:MAG: hypothetical protein ACXWLA_12290 [Myxococcaceae bacterium]